jgi:hypothetical protein
LAIYREPIHLTVKEKEGTPWVSVFTTGIATRFLDCFAEALLGQIMLEQGLIAQEKGNSAAPDSADGIFY